MRIDVSTGGTLWHRQPTKIDSGRPGGLQCGTIPL